MNKISRRQYFTELKFLIVYLLKSTNCSSWELTQFGNLQMGPSRFGCTISWQEKEKLKYRSSSFTQQDQIRTNLYDVVGKEIKPMTFIKICSLNFFLFEIILVLIFVLLYYISYVYLCSLYVIIHWMYVSFFFKFWFKS
jgi:hypothetical protein